MPAETALNLEEVLPSQLSALFRYQLPRSKHAVAVLKVPESATIHPCQTKTWLDFFAAHNISDANWAVSDKQDHPRLTPPTLACKSIT